MTEDFGLRFSEPKPIPAIPGSDTEEGIQPMRPPLWKRLLACNPFYLVSAALLLFGLNRIATDTSFFRLELTQLTFNFLSIQCYEMLLVATAILLLRRLAWYDSTLLVCLENLFVFVPFILISQASFINSDIKAYSIDSNWMWGFSATGGMLAAIRYSSLKRLAPAFNLPVRLLGFGAVFLAVNMALPVIFRHLHEFKVGTKPTEGAAFAMHEWSWMLILPALAGLLIFLPRPRATGTRLPQRRGWPFWWAAMWTGASGVHLYSLGYVYDFDLRPQLLAPVLWVLAWVVFARMDDMLLHVASFVRKAAMVLPVAVAWLATVGHGRGLFLGLACANAAVFLVLFRLNRTNRLALHLFLFSLISLLAMVPEAAGEIVRVDHSRGNWLVIGIVGYVLLCVALSRNASLAFVGAILAAVIPSLLHGVEALTVHWGIQCGLVFFLLHSLRWDHSNPLEATLVRCAAALVWMTHSFVWAWTDGDPRVIALVGGTVMAVVVLARVLGGQWGPWVIPISSLVVMLVGPLKIGAGRAGSLPAGVLAILVSFILFGFGTLLALNRHRWHQLDDEVRETSSSKP